MRRGYEFFEHTADAGAVVRGVTLPRLFENASHALLDLLCDRRTVVPRRRVLLRAAGTGREDLLVQWLTTLLVRVETDGWLFSRVALRKVSREGSVAVGAAWGEPIDRGRHRLGREVKAITRHALRIVRGRSAWRVRIVFDV